MLLKIDLCKHALHKERLVRQQVAVHTSKGTFMRAQWIDPNKLKKGEKVHTKFKQQFNDELKFHNQNAKDDEEFKDSSFNKTRLNKIFHNTFKGTSVEGLEHVYSDPHGSFYSKLQDVSPVILGKDEVEFNTNYTIYDHKDKPMGQISHVVNDKGDHLEVIFDLLTIHKGQQGNKVGALLSQRTEDFWKHLAHDKPVEIHLLANISVGAYAWATKGFDFRSEKEVVKARKELQNFLKENDIDESEMLKKNGYSNINELKHSWDFATLDDGNGYLLDNRTKTDLDGTKPVHLGKAFMLNGKSNWNGVKTFNPSKESDHEIMKQHQNSVYKNPDNTRG